MFLPFPVSGVPSKCTSRVVTGRSTSVTPDFQEGLGVVPKHVGSIRAALEVERCRRQLNSKEATRMDLHANAALSWSGRRELARRVVEEGWTLSAAAEAAGVSVRCARKWVSRYRAGDSQL